MKPEAKTLHLSASQQPVALSTPPAHGWKMLSGLLMSLSQPIVKVNATFDGSAKKLRVSAEPSRTKDKHDAAAQHSQRQGTPVHC